MTGAQHTAASHTALYTMLRNRNAGGQSGAKGVHCETEYAASGAASPKWRALLSRAHLW